MNKVIIIIPYYGILPKNFGSFLIGVKNNPRITWMIITDIAISKEYKVPDNLIVINMNFEMVKQRISKAAGCNVHCNTPYKMCDYKPLYGVAFEDYILSYDYWGYSDIDVVYGDLWKFIKEPIHKKIDKIGQWGHLTLFRNDRDVNTRFRLSIEENGDRINLFKRAASTNKVLHFDESDGINRIYSYNHFSVCINNNLVNDIFFENLDLISNDTRLFGVKGLYTYIDGRAIYYYRQKEHLESMEFGYFHFQKRHFTDFISEDINRFFVNSTGYHELSSIDEKSIEHDLESNHSSFSKRVAYLMSSYFKTNWFTDKHIGSFYFPIKYIFWRIFKAKNFIV